MSTVEENINNNDTKIAVLQNTNFYIHETLNRIEKRLDNLENRIDERFNKIEEKFDRIEEKFDRVDEKFDKVDEKFNRIEERFNETNKKIDSNFRWVIGSIFLAFGTGALASLLTITAKIMHWVS